MALLGVTNTNVSSAGGGGSFDDPIILSPGATFYTSAQKLFLRDVFFEDPGPAEITVRIGTTVGGEEISPDLDTISGYASVGLNLPLDAGTTLYFTGVSANTITKLYRR